MPALCEYLNCHNLGSELYNGYCNQEHMRKGPETKLLMEILRTHREISTLKEARTHTLTSFSHCEECKALLHGSDVYQAK